jgi:hypothetical protein
LDQQTQTLILTGGIHIRNIANPIFGEYRIRIKDFSGEIVKYLSGMVED